MYYGQYELDKIIHERFFPDTRDGFFVECGAFDGLAECTCKFFEESMNWKGLNIEAVPHVYDQLIQNRPNSINEKCALSSSNKKSIFTNAIHPGIIKFGNGSLAHTDSHTKSLIEQKCHFVKFEVECVRFEDLYRKHALPDIDLFVLDVEGHEIEALKGIITIPTNALPKVFCIENDKTATNELNDLLSNHYNYHSHHAHNIFYVKK